MPIPVEFYPDTVQLGRAVAEHIAVGMETARREGRRYVLGCPGGRSGRSTYAALRELVAERSMRLDHVVIVMMDDYVLTDSDHNASLVDAHEHYSCRRFAVTEIVAPLNAAAATPLAPDALWMPDPVDPAAYDGQIAAAGGIDLFLLASGATDGHVAFNPPGSPRDSRTRVVELASETRRDNLETFPDFRSLDEVPRHGVTVGIATIAELSRELVMILNGPHKHRAFQRITAASGYEESWPATVIHLGREGRIVADRAAAVGAPNAPQAPRDGSGAVRRAEP